MWRAIQLLLKTFRARPQPSDPTSTGTPALSIHHQAAMPGSEAEGLTSHEPAPLPPSSTVRIQLRMSKSALLTSCRNYNEFYRSFSNDQIFKIKSLYHELTGRHLNPPLVSDDDWLHFLDTMREFILSFNLINFRLYSMPDCYNHQDDLPFSFSAFDRLNTTMLLQSASSSQLRATSVKYITKMLSRYYHLKHQDVSTRNFRDTIDYIVEISLYMIPNNKSADFFDVFISYKTRRFAKDAQSLASSLNAMGIRCWLDKTQLQLENGEWVNDLLLKRVIRTAVSTSRLVVFFETHLEAVANETIRGDGLAFNWQMFERHFSKNVLYIHPKERTYSYRHATSYHSFFGEADLCEKIGNFLENDTAPGQPLSQSVFSEPDRENIDEQIQHIRDCLRELFGQEVIISKRMALIIMAPRSLHGNRIALGDDVFVNLLRYSPICALVLHEAGLSISKVLQAGIRDTETFWSPQGSYCAKDLFGHRNEHLTLGWKPTVLTDLALMLGLLHTAMTSNVALTDLLRRVGANGDTLQPVDAPVLIGRIQDALNKFEDQRQSASPCQQWILRATSDGIALHPFSEAGSYSVADLTGASAVNVTLGVSQENGIFHRSRISRLQELLARKSVDKARRLIDSMPSLRAMMEDADCVVPARVIASDDERVWNDSGLFMVIDRERWQHTEEVRSEEAGSSNVDTFVKAFSTLEPAKATPSGSIALGWKIYDVVIITSRSGVKTNSFRQARTFSLMDFEAEMLAPLLEYTSCSDMDYYFS